MKALVVIAHPLKDSLCQHLAEKTIAHLTAKGYEVTIKDLYQERFTPALSIDERQSYFEKQFDDSQLQQDITQLKEAESIILIFPTWWFGFPAILKGWIDRVWAPGHAYDHASDYGPIKPKLDNLKEMRVVTTLGSPWWVDLFILRQPIKKVIKFALLIPCAKKCNFKMLSLYSCENLSAAKVQKFVNKIQRRF